ncbi:MAG: undecaprenyl-diphosphate phosphatase [bacterium]
MLTYFQAVVLGLLQGVTELFPISSLGHTVILPSVLGWNIDQGSEFFLPFIVATHLATALVLLGFYMKDWIGIVRGFFRSLGTHTIKGDTHAKLAWLIFVSTIPAGILGILFEEKIEILFATPIVAAIFLMLNGVLLFGTELVRKRRDASERGDERIAKLTFDRAGWIGLAQAGALIPGLSRTGATIGGGLLAGLPHEEAARYSFLLATPVIFGAAILKLPVLFHASTQVLGATLLGAVAAAVAAYLSVRYLTHYFKTKTLTPFAVYCFAAGLLSLLLIVF